MADKTTKDDSQIVDVLQHTVRVLQEQLKMFNTEGEICISDIEQLVYDLRGELYGVLRSVPRKLSVSRGKERESSIMSENKVWNFCLFLTEDHYYGISKEVKVKVVAKDAVSAALEVGRQFSGHHYEVEILSYE